MSAAERLPTIQPEPVSDITEVVILVRSGPAGGLAWASAFMDSPSSGSAEAQARHSLANGHNGYAEYALVTVPIPGSMFKQLHRSDS